MNCVTGKTCYATEELAKEALIQNHIRNGHRTGSGPINYYKCNDCGNWHFTSKGNPHPMFSDAQTMNKIKKERLVQSWERRC